MDEEEQVQLQLDKLNYSITKNNTHVENSYLLKTRKAIRDEMDTIIFKREALRYPIRKNIGTYVNEWKGHNRLYMLGLFKNHTKDVDLEEPESLLMRIVWFIIGGL